MHLNFEVKFEIISGKSTKWRSVALTKFYELLVAELDVDFFAIRSKFNEKSGLKKTPGISAVSSLISSFSPYLY